MIRAGITGGIGSGKTTFCKKWEELGAFVLYADDFAKELMVKDPKLVQAIRETFGSGAYTDTGAINRAYLSKEAFGKGRVEELNRLVHPVLWERTAELATEKEQEGVEVFAYEAAILLNKGRPDNLDYVIMISAPEARRIERVAERDDSAEEDISDRIKHQPDFGELVHLCDYVVENNGSEQELREKAEVLYWQLLDLN